MQEFRIGGGPGRPPIAPWALFVPGGVLFGLGLLIYLRPELLAMLVSVMMMTIGAFLLLAAWRFSQGGGPRPPGL